MSRSQKLQVSNRFVVQRENKFREGGAADVHESIFFNGARYSVKLPWKEGHGSLPSNYELSLSRTKNQIRKLRKESEVLEEYDAFIKDQLASGVIETVTELEKVDQVHCIPHLAVVLCTTLLQRLGRGRGGGEHP